MNITKADEKAADRVLKAAVRKARDMIGGETTAVAEHEGQVVVYRWRRYDRDVVVDMLAEATRTADLLLTERAS